MNSIQPSFANRLTEKIRSCGTALCIGIDPDLENSSSFMHEWTRRHGAASYLEHFCRNLIEAGSGFAPAVKFQSAFFEAHGHEGFGVLERMMRLASTKGFLTILDAKRGDISSTMRAYGQLAFQVMKADALTVTPYMGTDTVSPLVPWLRQGHGVYLVWVTSNLSGSLIQDGYLGASGQSVSAHIFDNFRQFFEVQDLRDSYGWVLGATRIDSVDPRIRSGLHRERLLIPGIGAQGGQITGDMKSILASQQSLVSQSRGISKSSQELKCWEDFYFFTKAKIVDAARQVSAID